MRAPEGYRFSFPIEVRFRDLDLLGHVNNAVYLTYLESARMAYWLELTGQKTLSSFDMILARVEIDYRSPVVFGEGLFVFVRVASLRRSSFRMEFQILESATRRLVAEGRKVLVHYDYQAARSTPIPDALRQRIMAANPGARQEQERLAAPPRA